MRVGITGGTGFLGEYVVKALIEKGHTPVIISRSNKVTSNTELVHTNYLISDLKKKLTGLDAIVHLAAKRGGGEKFEDYEETINITQNIYQASYEIGLKNIVFASSISVYSDEKGLPWTESQLPTADSMYGISKYTCELIGNNYSRVKGMSIKNLRLAHLFGFNEKNNYMINLFMRQAFNGMPLKVNQSNISRREFLYAKDAAYGIIQSLNYNGSGTFNIGNSSNVLTNEEIANVINKIFNNPENIIINGDEKSKYAINSYMSNSLSEKSINFSPKYNIEKALREIYSQMGELINVPELY